MEVKPWLEPVDSVETRFESDRRRGLTAAEADLRFLRVGPNELASATSSTAAQLLARQFLNTMILILLAAAAVTLAVGDQIDAIVIGVIVVLNAGVGFAQEYRAERAMEELGQLTATTARAVRSGEEAILQSSKLVPGDVVRLATGDVVPADVRLLEATGLEIDEASLTGESEPVAKTTEAMSDHAAFVGDRRNMAHKGTAVTKGHADGFVVATGMHTELGRIAGLLGTDREGTPLQQRLASLGQRLAAIAAALCAVVFVSGLASGEPADKVFITAVSLAVAAIPEGLPAVVTIALALGARRMARHHALVRRLPAVETLGAVTVICTDKTGTLTQNRMSVERVWTRQGSYEIEGVGYEPDGTVTARRREGDERDDDLERVGRIATVCNDAALSWDPERSEWRVAGDPTEGALVVLGRRLESDTNSVGDRVEEIAFDSERRRMTVLHRTDGGYWVATKGALEALEPLLRGGEPVEEARTVAGELAAGGFRVLALAERVVGSLPDDLTDVERELRLVGIVGMSDPPRPETIDAIARCHDAGITTVMITGDHPSTATAIAHRVGLMDGTAEAVMTGQAVAGFDDDELAERIPRVRVFARTPPEQKLRIVEAWRRRGAVVAMTGDGVNDAPALQRADIGVAMGLTGTDVSREAADMVLADDNFATIVSAVEEGRRIYDNLRRFVRYLLTTNSAEVYVMLLGPLVGLPLPLTAAQILWINLVTDGLPAVALGLEPTEPDIMQRRPRPRDESILARGLLTRSLLIGAGMAAVVLPLQLVGEARGLPWQTMGFVTIALLQLGNALTSRAAGHRLRHLLGSNPLLGGAVLASIVAQLAVVYVPFLRTAFDTEALTAHQLGVVLGVSLVVFLALELLSQLRPAAKAV